MRFGGTYACPICFKDTPHEHTGLEVYRHHEEQLEYHKLESPAHEALRAEQKIRRGTLAARGHKAREDNLKAAQSAIENYEGACHFCRDLPRGARSLKSNCGWLYGLIVDLGENTASCPECEAILAHWE